MNLSQRALATTALSLAFGTLTVGCKNESALCGVKFTQPVEHLAKLSLTSAGGKLCTSESRGNEEVARIMYWGGPERMTAIKQGLTSIGPGWTEASCFQVDPRKPRICLENDQAFLSVTLESIELPTFGSQLKQPAVSEFVSWRKKSAAR